MINTGLFIAVGLIGTAATGLLAYSRKLALEQLADAHRSNAASAAALEQVLISRRNLTLEFEQIKAALALRDSQLNASEAAGLRLQTELDSQKQRVLDSVSKNIQLRKEYDELAEEVARLRAAEADRIERRKAAKAKYKAKKKAEKANPAP